MPNTHGASQCQALNSAGAIVAADSGTNAVNKVSWLVPTNKLSYGSNYLWKLCYRDSRNGWSSIWSNATPAPVIVGGQYIVTNNMTNKFKFYRLKKQVSSGELKVANRMRSGVTPTFGWLHSRPSLLGRAVRSTKVRLPL